MASVNKITLLGRLGKDPELRKAASGTSVCKFSLATDSGWGDNKSTDWHNIVVFDKTADACNKYLEKGRQAYIEGRVTYRTWDKDDGTKGYITEIIANDVQFLGGKQDGERKDGSSSQGDDAEVDF